MTDKFLSTPSARRATSERHRVQRSNRISIHALREEGDLPFPQHTALAQYFYPRPPRGGRRLRRSARSGDPPISIHALREEGDGMNLTLGWCGTNFYPRPPRGGRQAVAWRHPTVKEFLSTPSARRATNPQQGDTISKPISIHALREEGDLLSVKSLQRSGQFLSTPSARRATSSSVFRCCTFSISIHALREEGDERALKLVKESITFLSTPSVRRATQSFRARL